MAKRVRRDCPVPNCGAKNLVRLANHLADVHLLDIDKRRKYLQEAKRQPKCENTLSLQDENKDAVVDETANKERTAIRNKDDNIAAKWRNF